MIVLFLWFFCAVWFVHIVPPPPPFLGAWASSVPPPRVRPGSCLHFDNGKRYLSADVRIDCTSARYRALFAYSCAVAAVVLVGFPAVLFAVLRRHRRRLYPQNFNRIVRVKHSDPDGGTSCIVACVETAFAPQDRVEFRDAMQRVGRALALRSFGPAQHRASLPYSVGSTVLRSWEASPGPGDSSLQRHPEEAMFHFALPPSHTRFAAVAVDLAVRDWHVAPKHYDLAADVAARDADPSLRHLSFLFNVRRWGWWAARPLGVGDGGVAPVVDACVCVRARG